MPCLQDNETNKGVWSCKDNETKFEKIQRVYNIISLELNRVNLLFYEPERERLFT